MESLTCSFKRVDNYSLKPLKIAVTWRTQVVCRAYVSAKICSYIRHVHCILFSLKSEKLGVRSVVGWVVTGEERDGGLRTHRSLRMRLSRLLKSLSDSWNPLGMGGLLTRAHIAELRRWSGREHAPVERLSLHFLHLTRVFSGKSQCEFAIQALLLQLLLPAHTIDPHAP